MFFSRVFFGREPILFLLLITLTLAGCGQKSQAVPSRYGVVRFENLSGDPSLEWTGRAAPELLSGTLSGKMDGPVIAASALTRVEVAFGDRPAGAPGISSQRIAAQLSGVTRLISGYVEKVASGVRVTAVEDDLTSGKRIRVVSVLDSSPMKALTGLAHAFSTGAGPYQTKNEDVFRLYCVARESPADVARADLNEAIQKDPGFGPAWEALIQYETTRGDRAGAEQLIARAREQKLDPLTAARVDFEASVLGGDQKEKLAALKRVSALSPGDTVLTQSLAETEAAVGQFAESAAEWRKLREVLTTDPNVWNQLGYTQAWSGDYPGAVKTMEGYAKMRPEDPNPLDSLGDVHYLNRKFPEAAAAYGQVCSKFPNFQTGGDFYKAAWAKFMAGDKKGAEADFAEFSKVRAKSGNVTLISADWLYRTGHPKEAVAELRTAVSTENAPPAEKSAWAGQLAVWDLLQGDRALAAKDAEGVGAPTTPGAFLVRFVTMPSASVSEWQARGIRMLPTPAAAGLRQLAIAYALILDGKKMDAAPIFKTLSESSPATDFTLRYIAARVQGTVPRLELLPDPGSINPFLSVLPAPSN